jgi:hypothetical protein
MLKLDQDSRFQFFSRPTASLTTGLKNRNLNFKVLRAMRIRRSVRVCDERLRERATLNLSFSEYVGCDEWLRETGKSMARRTISIGKFNINRIDSLGE